MGALGNTIVATLLIVALLAAITLTTRQRIRSAAQVTARHPTDAPLWWMVVPTPAALLHRRLRDAVRVVTSAVPPPRKRRAEPNRVQTMAAELERMASAADREIILASRSPRGQRIAALLRANALVQSIEDQSVRLVALGAELDPRRHTPKDWELKMSELDLRLQAHEEALAELARFDVTIDTTATDGWGAGGPT